MPASPRGNNPSRPIKRGRVSTLSKILNFACIRAHTPHLTQDDEGSINKTFWRRGQTRERSGGSKKMSESEMITNSKGLSQQRVNRGHIKLGVFILKIRGQSGGSGSKTPDKMAFYTTKEKETMTAGARVRNPMEKKLLERERASGCSGKKVCD